ncbi:MAG: hypothetical protein P1V51_02185 [Deltaproteobacteria bacterium]|nr:hypothetical protein [Deltaproteobacteria bacterium]
MSDLTHPDDRLLLEALEALEPLPAQVARMRGRVHAKLEAERASLLGEWLALLRVRPVVHTAYLFAAAVVLLVSTPLGALLRALLLPSAS